MSSSHIRLYFSTARAKRIASGSIQPGPQSSARLTLVAEHVLHRGDAIEHVVEAALADQPGIHGAVKVAGLAGCRSGSRGKSRFIVEWKLMPCFTMKKFSGSSIIHLAFGGIILGRVPVIGRRSEPL